MMATISTLLSGGLGTFLIGVISKFLTSWLSDIRNDRNQKEIGKLQAERDAAIDALKKQDEMAAIAARQDTEDDILKRLDNASG